MVHGCVPFSLSLLLSFWFFKTFTFESNPNWTQFSFLLILPSCWGNGKWPLSVRYGFGVFLIAFISQIQATMSDSTFNIHIISDHQLLRVPLVFHVTMFCCIIYCFMSVSCNSVLCHFSCDMFDIVSSLTASGEGQSLKKQCSSKLAQLSPNSNSIRWQRIVHMSKSPHARPWQCFQMLQTFCQKGRSNI